MTVQPLAAPPHQYSCYIVPAPTTVHGPLINGRGPRGPSAAHVTPGTLVSTEPFHSPSELLPWELVKGHSVASPGSRGDHSGKVCWSGH